jgi:putative FmdB family regulatory protein
MPIYEYTCSTCEHDFEILLRGSERASCPECGGDRLEKQFSVPAAHTGSAGSLPICEPPRFSVPANGPGTCGRPQCGTGGCMMQ